MYNFRIDVRGEGQAALMHAVRFAFEANWTPKQATHFIDHTERGLVLFWSEEEASTPLPFPHDAEQSAVLIWNWLQRQPDTRYIDRLDHDGDNGRGFRLYNEAWGRVGQYRYAIVACLPCWAWYGK